MRRSGCREYVRHEFKSGIRQNGNIGERAHRQRPLGQGIDGWIGRERDDDRDAALDDHLLVLDVADAPLDFSRWTEDRLDEGAAAWDGPDFSGERADQGLENDSD